jgi:hypothetical protein
LIRCRALANLKTTDGAAREFNITYEETIGMEALTFGEENEATENHVYACCEESRCYEKKNDMEDVDVEIV